MNARALLSSGRPRINQRLVIKKEEAANSLINGALGAQAKIEAAKSENNNETLPMRARPWCMHARAMNILSIGLSATLFAVAQLFICRAMMWCIVRVD